LPVQVLRRVAVVTTAAAAVATLGAAACQLLPVSRGLGVTWSCVNNMASNMAALARRAAAKALPGVDA